MKAFPGLESGRFCHLPDAIYAPVFYESRLAFNLFVQNVLPAKSCGNLKEKKQQYTTDTGVPSNSHPFSLIFIKYRWGNACS
jgi:hypothetical protein